MPQISTLQERIVFENTYVSVFDNDVQFPSGLIGRYFRYRWKAPHGVAIVPIVNREIILVESYRYSELNMSLEIPQGFGLKGSLPENDARRELFEETALEASTLRPLLVLGSDFKTHVFMADIEPGQTPAAINMEKSESICSYRRIPIDEVSPESLQSLGIFDATTLSALFATRLTMT